MGLPKPQVIVEIPLNPEKVTGGVISLYYFENAQGGTIKMNTEHDVKHFFRLFFEKYPGLYSIRHMVHTGRGNSHTTLVN